MGFHFMVFGPPRSQQSKIPGRTRNHVSKIQVYPRAIFATYHGPGVCVYPAGPPASQRLPASVSLTHVVGLWLDCGWTQAPTGTHTGRLAGTKTLLLYFVVLFFCAVSRCFTRAPCASLSSLLYRICVFWSFFRCECYGVLSALVLENKTFSSIFAMIKCRAASETGRN